MNEGCLRMQDPGTTTTTTAAPGTTTTSTAGTTTTTEATTTTTAVPKACSKCTADMLMAVDPGADPHPFDSAMVVTADGCATFVMVCSTDVPDIDPSIEINGGTPAFPTSGGTMTGTIYCNEEGTGWIYPQDGGTAITTYGCSAPTCAEYPDLC
ncbi:unnamed protein product, partial [Mesorhabditis spiculigera]